MCQEVNGFFLCMHLKIENKKEVNTDKHITLCKRSIKYMNPGSAVNDKTSFRSGALWFSARGCAICNPHESEPIKFLSSSF